MWVFSELVLRQWLWTNLVHFGKGINLVSVYLQIPKTEEDELHTPYVLHQNTHSLCGTGFSEALKVMKFLWNSLGYVHYTCKILLKSCSLKTLFHLFHIHSSYKWLPEVILRPNDNHSHFEWVVLHSFTYTLTPNELLDMQGIRESWTKPDQNMNFLIVFNRH